jgi:hypothetical protein
MKHRVVTKLKCNFTLSKTGTKPLPYNKEYLKEAFTILLTMDQLPDTRMDRKI